MVVIERERETGRQTENSCNTSSAGGTPSSSSSCSPYIIIPLMASASIAMDMVESASARMRASSMSSTGTQSSGSGGTGSPPIGFSDPSSPDLQELNVRRLFFGPSDAHHAPSTCQSILTYTNPLMNGPNINGSMITQSYFCDIQLQQPQQKQLNSYVSNQLLSSATLPKVDSNHQMKQRNQRGPPGLVQMKRPTPQQAVRVSSAGTIFNRRLDYSNFNVLPQTKINSYHIRMEDETSHGNDELRNFILSSLSSNHVNRIECVMCCQKMIIYDKYPLIDGTFFLSPRQYSMGSSVPIRSIQANVQTSGQTSSASSSRSSSSSSSSSTSSKKSSNNNNNSTLSSSLKSSNQYLSAVCMGCLEGWNMRIKCKFCGARWKGSELILGSMYSYDIFASTPCCIDRYKCNTCHQPVIAPDRRLEFFSDYSQQIPCAHCGSRDHHFVKPLSSIFVSDVM